MADYILSLSYGKDSLACLGAIEKLGLPLTRIVHAEVWATDTIPADLPPMVEFKAKADAIIKARWGIEVEHKRAIVTFEQQFYRFDARFALEDAGLIEPSDRWLWGYLKDVPIQMKLNI